MSHEASWPASEEELVEVQRRLAAEAAGALADDPFLLPPEGDALVGGCFVAYAPGEAGPGHAGDRAWAAAVVCAVGATGATGAGGARPAAVVARAVVAGRVPAAYSPGLLALREGPLLAAAVGALGTAPDVLLVDATGLDHPRRAGLALHLGAVLGRPTVGVTDKPLAAETRRPAGLLRRGATEPVLLDGRPVARWVCTRTGVRPVLAHAAWRTDAGTAAAVVLAASTEAARAPYPSQAARVLARGARRVE